MYNIQLMLNIARVWKSRRQRSIQKSAVTTL